MHESRPHESAAPPFGQSSTPGELALRAKERLAGPAIALQVTAGLGAFWTLAASAATWMGVLAARAQREIGGDEALIASFVIGTKLVLALIVALLVWIGASRMRELRGHGLALVVSVLAILPCVSPCCWLGLPFGLWSLFVLLDSEVRRSFR